MPVSARSVLSAAVAVLALAGFTAAHAAHGDVVGRGADDTPRVDARQARQQARIADGLADGSLSRAEARHLQRQQRQIRQAERHAKADGVVTPAERQHLAALQQHASRSIQRLRHDMPRHLHRAG